MTITLSKSCSICFLFNISYYWTGSVAYIDGTTTTCYLGGNSNTWGPLAFSTSKTLVTTPTNWSANQEILYLAF